MDFFKFRVSRSQISLAFHRQPQLKMRLRLIWGVRYGRLELRDRAIEITGG